MEHKSISELIDTLEEIVLMNISTLQVKNVASSLRNNLNNYTRICNSIDASESLAIRKVTDLCTKILIKEVNHADSGLTIDNEYKLYTHSLNLINHIIHAIHTPKGWVLKNDLSSNLNYYDLKVIYEYLHNHFTLINPGMEDRNLVYVFNQLFRDSKLTNHSGYNKINLLLGVVITNGSSSTRLSKPGYGTYVLDILNILIEDIKHFKGVA